VTAAHDPLYDHDGWWDPGCRGFASLRSISTFRLDLLRRWLPGPWRDRTVVDLGCGGGLLAVPLAADGARVVGVDLARRALLAGARRGERLFQPVGGDILQPPVADACADLVLLADVLEHVDDPRTVVAAAAALVRPGGHLFINTIHRTARARLLAITLAEGLGFVPRGTHLWRRFVAPAELERFAGAAGLQLVRQVGEVPRLFATLRRGAIALRESDSLAVAYGALYRRRA